MGDAERSTEAEQEAENEMKMVLQCPPLHPLPEEIEKMARSETVCCYCGVSYLIFHEFHQLQTKVAQLEVELQEVRETAQQEKTQREALELGRLEWERALHLGVQREAEEKEKRIRKGLEERNKDVERALRTEFEKTNERKWRDMKEEYQKISEEKERRLTRELGDLEAERLKRQREELERKTKDREKVLNDELQTANKNVDELRKCFQQLEKRLEIAASKKKKAEQLLRKENQEGESLRGVCARQLNVLQATVSTLRSSGRELTAVRGFLSQMMGVWQAFKSQILQHNTQVFSVLREELKHSSEEFKKMREEKEHLTEQLMEQKTEREEQLSQQKDSEKEHRETLLRFKGELAEKHQRWLSCQQRCNTIQEQLLSLQQREEQMNRKCYAAEGEVTQLREALEKVHQEARELRREREISVESHGRALTKMEEDNRQQISSKLAAALKEERTQNALHLREQMEALRREVDSELKINRENNQLLLLQYQHDSTQLQQKMEAREQELQGLRDELQEEKRRRRRREEEEEAHQERQRSRQQEALRQSRAEADLQLMAERTAELQEEVALLQETVRRECEEREELTAALCQAHGELLRLRSPACQQASSRPPASPAERDPPPPGSKHIPLHSQAHSPLTCSPTPPNTLRPPPACTDKEGGRGTGGGGGGGGAGGSVESWNGGRVKGGEKRREGTLARLKGSGTMSDAKRKVSLVMGRKERL